jgi:Flp pilus assembly pilin Flp
VKCAIRSFWKDEGGQDLVEYTLLAAFVGTAAAALVPTIAATVSQIFSKIPTVLANAAGP